MMSQIKMCPECDGIMQEIKFLASVGSSKDEKDPSEEWRVKYYCPKCEKEFLEDDLS